MDRQKLMDTVISVIVDKILYSCSKCDSEAFTCKGFSSIKCCMFSDEGERPISFDLRSAVIVCDDCGSLTQHCLSELDLLDKFHECLTEEERKFCQCQ